MDNIKQYEKQNKKSECISYQLPKEERKVMNKILKIDDELRDLLPPLSLDEFELLEENIKANGCIDPIVTWQEIIIDGHNRYNICNKHNLQFQSIELGFKTKDDVIQWMIETQLGRRNLSPLQRVQIAEKYREPFKRQSEKRMLSGKSDPMQKSAQGSTRDALAKIAKVSHDTYNKAKQIVELEEKENKGEISLTEKQKQFIEKAKKDEIKVNTAFNELFGKSKIENKQKQEEKHVEKTIEEPKIEVKSLTVEQNLPKDNIKEIIKDMKTSKYVENTFNFLEKLDYINQNIEDCIRTSHDNLFERHNIDGKITQEEKNIALEFFQDLINKMIELKNKINNIKIKEIK